MSVLTIGVGALAVIAYQRATPTLSSMSAAPVPTFALGAHTPTPTPTPTREPATISRASERFLTVAAGTLWRATAGVCGTAEPLIERSNDGGRSWIDVTPRYTGIAQVASLDGLAVDAVEAVAAVGTGCEVQALRSFTNGEFWESFPDVLPVVRYIDFADPGVIHMQTGPLAAPCPLAHGLRALRQTVSLVCEDIAYVWRNEQWVPLPEEDVLAVGIADADVISVSVSVECAGMKLTRFAGGDPSAATPAGCAAVMDATAPAAIVVYPDGILVWSGTEVITVR